MLFASGKQRVDHPGILCCLMGSHSGAEKAAIVYSLLGSCKLQDINPYDYLQDVLERLPEHPVNRLNELLPPNWKPAKVRTLVEN